LGRAPPPRKPNNNGRFGNAAKARVEFLERFVKKACGGRHGAPEDRRKRGGGRATITVPVKAGLRKNLEN